MSVMPVKTGIQAFGMDPGFHRGDDNTWIICAGMTEGEPIRV